MVCDCCGRRRWLLESYAAYKAENGSINLCPACNDLVYVIRASIEQDDKEKLKDSLAKLNQLKVKSSDQFDDWWKNILQGFCDR